MGELDLSLRSIISYNRPIRPIYVFGHFSQMDWPFWTEERQALCGPPVTGIGLGAMSMSIHHLWALLLPCKQVNCHRFELTSSNWPYHCISSPTTLLSSGSHWVWPMKPMNDLAQEISIIVKYAYKQRVRDWLDFSSTRLSMENFGITGSKQVDGFLRH